MSDLQRLNEAIKYAVDCHAAQCRKGSSRPYILHPLEVVSILNAMGADTNLMIAGLLHDTIEDAGITAEDIRSRFGSGVAQLVCAHTEDKSKSWQQRKTAAIEELRRANRRLAWLILADKLSNLRSMQRDHAAVGEALWDRFNAPKAQQAWYYSGILDALQPLFSDPNAGPFCRELQALYQTVFCP